MPRASVRRVGGAVVLSFAAFAAFAGGAHTAYGAPTAADRAAHAVHKATDSQNVKKPKKPKKHKAKHTPSKTDHSAEPCGGVRPPKPGGVRYTCTFTDNFNGPALNTAKWTIATSAATGLTTYSGGCYLGDPAHVSIAAGTLRLTSEVEPRPFYCGTGLLGIVTQHVAASVVTVGKFAQRYGRFEFRAKFPKTTTVLNSALWMYPAHEVYGKWPSSGELDVAERFGSSRGDHIYPSLHYYGQQRRVTNTGMNCRVAGSDTSFHRYAVEWTKSSIKFYYDGRWCFTGSWAPGAPLVRPQPFDQPFYLVMTEPDGAPNTPVGAHDTMTIDWVRAWR